MYLSQENFTCLKEQVSFLCLNDLFYKNSMKPDINSLLNSVHPNQLASNQDPHCFQCKIINQNMKYRIVLTLYICTCPRARNINFQFVLNEMGPGRTSRAWYFDSPAAYPNILLGGTLPMHQFNTICKHIFPEKMMPHLFVYSEML